MGGGTGGGVWHFGVCNLTSGAQGRSANLQLRLAGEGQRRVWSETIPAAGRANSKAWWVEWRIPVAKERHRG